MAGKRRLKGIFEEPAKPRVFLRKRAQNRIQELETSEQTPTFHRKTRRQTARKEEKDRPENWPIRRLSAPVGRVGCLAEVPGDRRRGLGGASSPATGGRAAACKCAPAGWLLRAREGENA